MKTNWTENYTLHVKRESDGETFRHTIYKAGDDIDTLTFEYRRKEIR